MSEFDLVEYYRADGLTPLDTRWREVGAVHDFYTGGVLRALAFAVRAGADVLGAEHPDYLEAVAAFNALHELHPNWLPADEKPEGPLPELPAHLAAAGVSRLLSGRGAGFALGLALAHPHAVGGEGTEAHRQLEMAMQMLSPQVVPPMFWTRGHVRAMGLEYGRYIWGELPPKRSLPPVVNSLQRKQ